MSAIMAKVSLHCYKVAGMQIKTNFPECKWHRKE